MTETLPYKGVDSKTRFLPIITYENRWLRLLGPGLEIKLGRTGPVDLGLLVSYADDGYKPDDSSALTGMAERKSGFWLGARAQTTTPWANLSAEWSADVSSHSKGQKIKLTAEHRFSLGDAGITPRLSATWTDRRYTTYYYGVTADEATPDRPAYSPGATVSTEAGLRLDYQIAPKNILFADVSVRALGNAMKDSPLVERSSVSGLRLGYLYRF